MLTGSSTPPAAPGVCIGGLGTTAGLPACTPLLFPKSVAPPAPPAAAPATPTTTGAFGARPVRPASPPAQPAASIPAPMIKNAVIRSRTHGLPIARISPRPHPHPLVLTGQTRGSAGRHL